MTTRCARSSPPRHAALYGRIGTCNQEFGTLTSWLVDVVNILTGNFDRPGGLMFGNPIAWGVNSLPNPALADGVQLGQWKSRVRGIPEVLPALARLGDQRVVAGRHGPVHYAIDEPGARIDQAGIVIDLGTDVGTGGRARSLHQRVLADADRSLAQRLSPASPLSASRPGRVGRSESVGGVDSGICPGAVISGPRVAVRAEAPRQAVAATSSQRQDQQNEPVSHHVLLSGAAWHTATYLSTPVRPNAQGGTMTQACIGSAPGPRRPPLPMAAPSPITRCE